MRITNTMITNQTLANVGKSKNNLSDIENQMSTEKKITRPSDDPIVAIRALSLRSSLSEINQYLEHNIPDAESWYEITEGALNNMDKILQDVYELSNQGSSDQFTANDRSAVIEVLKQYKSAIYNECNTSFSDRFIFSGYKTDTSFTFQTDVEAKKNYQITETFTGDDLRQIEVMGGSLDLSGGLQNINSANYPATEKYYSLQLAYSGCKQQNTVQISYTAANGANATVNATGITQEQLEQNMPLSNAACYYVYDTGAIVMGNSVYDNLKDATNISLSYTKEGFAKGDVRPEMYFDCVDVTDTSNPINYTHRSDEAINYTVNFSQTIQVNTRGCDTLSTNIGRDIDMLCNALQAVQETEDKISKIKEMQGNGQYTSTWQQEELSSMLAAAEQEHDYALNYMEDLFSHQMTRVKGYQQTVDLQLADLGARETRLSLTKSRITQQQTTFKDLKSKNEDVELEDAVINYSAAKTLYQAALTAASDTVKESLLNYI